MKKVVVVVLRVVLVLAVLGALIGGVAWWWVKERAVALQTPIVDYRVEQGMGLRQIAQRLRDQGVYVNEDVFVALARLTKQDRQLQAGAYEIKQGDSLWQILERMVAGDMTHSSITFIEGWTVDRMLDSMQQHPDLKHTLDTPEKVHAFVQELGATYPYVEGLFYPDTYVFAPGSTDQELLRRAYQAQADILQQMWAQRDQDLPLSTPYEALILASIVEKETGHAADRERVAGVFINRLRINMPLQTDPTVIYGMGKQYEGRIRKRDLTTDTPWNTYTRNGLPPSPIALASKASLQAVLHPEQHNFYYFVSRGDGTSEFSKNLTDHNRAVRRYILNKGQ